MMQKKYAKMLYSSPIGFLSLVADDHYLYGIWFQGQSNFERGLVENSLEIVKSHPILDQVIFHLDAYFDGQTQDLSSLPLAPLWTYLQGILYGQTVTYGKIAQDLQVASAQAIGGAVGRNPWSILIPCHRVLGKRNRLTGYAAGVEKKAWLLAHEGIHFQE